MRFPRRNYVAPRNDKTVEIIVHNQILRFAQNDRSKVIAAKEAQPSFSSKAVSCNFFVKPDEQREGYFCFAVARKSA